jgi:DNA modification methylase
MMKKVKLSELQIHPLVLGIINNTSNPSIQFSMKHDGQKTPIVVVKRDNGYSVIDGVHRYNAAVELGNVETLICEVLDIGDEQILDTRITYNQKSKIHTLEVCRNIEHLLGLIGSEQGKRNDLLGNQNFEDDKEFGSAGKDRFERACLLSGLTFSSRTLRKLMAVYDYEKKDNSLGLIECIENGTYKIESAYKLMLSSRDKDDKKNAKQRLKIEALNQDIWFKVFAQSSIDLSNLKKYRPQFAMFSPTYWTMKEYPNQDEMNYGQEATLKEYLCNSRKFINALIEIMDENGVIAIVIGESYAGGYKSIITQYEMMLIESGLEILGVCEWIKSNPTPVVLESFFRPANEKIIVCKMKGAVVNFNPKMKKTKEGKKMVKKSHKAKDGSDRFFIQDDETIISNIIRTPVFNDSEYKKYDSGYTHEAPCPMAIYEAIVESYTLPGMTCIDIHCGSGQGLEVFARHGCNAIGVDVDPVSVEFCEKRMSMLLGEKYFIYSKMAA